MVKAELTAFGWMCECGALWLRATEWNDGTIRLSSHLSPGEKDPHRFCEFSHEEVVSEEPKLWRLPTTRHAQDDEIYQLGGRKEEEVVDAKDYYASAVRVPLGVLGASLSDAQHTMEF